MEKKTFIKKLSRLLGVIVLIPLFFGCEDEFIDNQNSTGQMVIENHSFKDHHLCGDPLLTDLMADQDLDVGDVTIGNDETTVYVTITTTGDWLMTNAKVWIGTDPGELPVNKSGNPLRGQFPVNEDFDPGKTSETYTFAIADLGEGIDIGSNIYVAVHADFEMEYWELDELLIREETAWGFGTEIGGKAWGWYLEYEIQACSNCPDHVIIFRNGEPWTPFNPKTAQEDILEILGFTPGLGPNTYEILHSDQINVKELDPGHDLVIISSGQFPSFYANIIGKELYFYEFASSGGKLLIEPTTMYTDISLFGMPSGINYVNYVSQPNYVVDNTHPMVAGLPDRLFGYSASTFSFTNLPEDAVSYYTDDLGNTTLAEIPYGDGIIWLSGQTHVFFYNTDFSNMGTNMQLLLPRLYPYLLCQDPPQMKAKQIIDSESSPYTIFEAK